jgi:hypothetical protein
MRFELLMRNGVTMKGRRLENHHNANEASVSSKKVQTPHAAALPPQPHDPPAILTPLYLTL